jgi:hypothetical protein
MKNNFTDLSQKRSLANALLFYIITFLLLIGLSMAAGFVGALTFGLEYEGGLRLGALIAVIACSYLSFTTASLKGIKNKPGVIALIVITPVLALFLGGLGGLIPVAALSTFDSSEGTVDPVATGQRR